MNAAEQQWSPDQYAVNVQRAANSPQAREQRQAPGTAPNTAPHAVQKPAQHKSPQSQNVRQVQAADKPHGNSGSVSVNQTSNRADSPVANNPNAGNPIPVKSDRHKKSEEMQAKTTEVKHVEFASVKRSENMNSGQHGIRKKEKVKFTDGEGGNTVVSVVKAIVYIIFVVIISIFSSIFIILVGNDVFAFVKNDEVREVVIPEYATLDEVASILHENEIIAYPKIFKLYAVAKKDDGEYVAGTYSISPMYNYSELLDEFKEKPVTGWQEIMIPEGYTTDDIINLFVSKGIGTKEGFVDAINNYDFDYWFIDELGEDWAADGRIYRLDGYLFPDTYQFYNNSSEVTVIKKLLTRFNQIFTQEYRNQCAEMGYTVDEMITLASMIEKEAGSAAEFFYVSSVFHNRLNNPSVFPKLESDATIVYAIQHDTGSRPTLTGSDLTYDTPYNTYTHNGLPPGPIANPSASAMLAALSPTKTNYYYFVSDAGVTYFSETKAEHDAYIAEIVARQSAAAQQTTGDMSAEEAAASGQTEGQNGAETTPA